MSLFQRRRTVNSKLKFLKYLTVFTNTIYWTLTDQETYIVIVICIENKNKMWNVLSTKPKLEDDVAAKIGAHVQSLGFDANKFNVVDYSLC